MIEIKNVGLRVMYNCSHQAMLPNEYGGEAGKVKDINGKFAFRVA